LGDREHVVVVTMHHIVTDGWSMGVLVDEFGRLYGARVQRRPSPLPPLVRQYRDFTAWQEEWLESAMAAEPRRGWAEPLAGRRLPWARRCPIVPDASSRG